MSRIFSTKLVKKQQKVLKTISQSIEFHTAASKDLANFNHTQYYKKVNQLHFKT